MLIHRAHHSSALDADCAHPGLRSTTSGHRKGMGRGRLIFAAPVVVGAAALGLLAAGHSGAAPAPTPAIAPSTEVQLLDPLQYVCAGHESLATVPGAVVVDCAG